MLEPSAYQLAVFAHVEAAVQARRQGRPWQNLVVSAAPGSGKTVTVVATCHRLPGIRSLVVAFGRRVADELSAKLPSSAEAMTLHSLGLAAWSRFVGRPEVAGNKLWRIADKMAEDGELPRWMKGKAVKLAELARMHGVVPGSRAREGVQRAPGGEEGAGGGSQQGVGSATAPARSYSLQEAGDVLAGGGVEIRGLVPDVDDVWSGLMAQYDVYCDAPGKLIAAARDLLRTSIRFGHRIIDFGDMIYLPALCEAVRLDQSADVVFVDELQDLDHLQRRMILRMTGRSVFVGVGDPKQAIFAWRGAAEDSMDLVRRATRATTLPLSICYRCPESHVRLARRYSPDIEAAPGAAAGAVERFGADGFLQCDRAADHPAGCACARRRRPEQVGPASFRPGDVVVCRSKGRLVRAAFWLLARRVPARVLGKDIGSGILAFVDSLRLREPNLDSLLVTVERVTNKAVDRAREQGDEAAAEEASDRRDVITAVAEAVLDEGLDDKDEIPAFRRQLQDLFGDGEDRDTVVTFSTIHRFKGGQGPRIWWLDPDKPDPSSPAYRKDWQRTEAENLRLVASTRSTEWLGLLPPEALS